MIEDRHKKLAELIKPLNNEEYIIQQKLIQDIIKNKKLSHPLILQVIYDIVNEYSLSYYELATEAEVKAYNDTCIENDELRTIYYKIAFISYYNSVVIENETNTLAEYKIGLYLMNGMNIVSINNDLSVEYTLSSVKLNKVARDFFTFSMRLTIGEYYNINKCTFDLYDDIKKLENQKEYNLPLQYIKLRYYVQLFHMFEISEEKLVNKIGLTKNELQMEMLILTKKFADIGLINEQVAYSQYLETILFLKKTNPDVYKKYQPIIDKYKYTSETLSNDCIKYKKSAEKQTVNTINQIKMSDIYRFITTEAKQYCIKNLTKVYKKIVNNVLPGNIYKDVNEMDEFYIEDSSYEKILDELLERIQNKTLLNE